MRHPRAAAYKARKLFLEGELDTRSIIQSIYTPVVASEAAVVAFALQVAKLRPGFAELVAAARERGAPFFLASGGLRQYIEAVIAAHLAPELRDHIWIRANEAAFSPAGLRVTYPGDAESRKLGCDVCGSCKRVADRTFARADSYLHRYCKQHALPCTPFTDLHAAAEAVRGYPGKAA